LEDSLVDIIFSLGDGKVAQASLKRGRFGKIDQRVKWGEERGRSEE